MDVLKARVADVLRVKFELGLFDHPYVDPNAADRMVLNEEHVAAGLRASRESLVLLKNDHDLLPLKKSLLKVLVCGPNADESWFGENRYGPNHVDVVTVLAGIKEKLHNSGAGSGLRKRLRYGR